ncbi:PAS domain S-box protein, partial [archaeon]|nr:PAS domain S-box protein [archaeon]
MCRTSPPMHHSAIRIRSCSRRTSQGNRLYPPGNSWGDSIYLFQVPISTFDMQSNEEEYEDRFREETKELLYQRVLAVLLVGILLIPFFTVLDYVVVREHFKLFFIYRITCSALITVLLLIYYTKYGRAYTYPLVTLAYIIAALTISFMCVKMGGYDSFYYVGLIMVLVTIVIMPLNIYQALLFGLMIYLIYVLPIVFLSTPTPESLKVFFSNSFFFVFFIVITTIQAYEETKARKRECKLKAEMEYLASRLSYYAHNLEAEVEKRIRELKESEFRYQELYENIIDIVILVDRHGRILMANPRFYDIIGIAADQKLDFSFMNIVKKGDATLVERMLDRLPTEQTVKDFQFRIVNRLGRIIEVECNAK